MRLCIRALPKKSRRQGKPSQEATPTKRRQKFLPRTKGGGAPTSASTGKPHRNAMRRASVLRSSDTGGLGSPGSLERARSPFGAPPRLSEVFTPARLQAALPGITGCKREDPLRHQCSEHLAVRHAPDGTLPKPPVRAVYGYAHENRSRSASRSTLAIRRPSSSGMFGDVTVMGTNVKGLVA